MNPIRLVDVTLRDGIQSETERIPTLEQKITLGHQLLRAGVRELEIGSFVNYARFPALADTAALFRALQPAATQASAQLSTLIFNERGAREALAVGVSRIAVVVGVDPHFEQKNANRTPAESLQALAPLVATACAQGATVRGYVSTCYHAADGTPIPPSAVIAVATALQQMGCDEISLGDTFASATPTGVEALLSALIAAGIPAQQCAAHFHVAPTLRDRALANLDAALRMGVRTIDAACAGIGGCPSIPEKAHGNMATEDVAAHLQWPTAVALSNCAQLVRSWFASQA